jgi:myo-inositol-1(or 4)-monophosphatase
VALDVSREAAALMKTGWGRVTEIRSKGSAKDLVTEWDTRVEDLIAARLAERAPGTELLAEEGGRRALGTGPGGPGLWIVDPIDGTVNFAHGLPVFCVSVAYKEAGLVQAGVVIAPILGWELAAARGLGATFNGERLAVSVTPRLDEALLATGFPYDLSDEPTNNFAAFLHMQRVSGAVRRLGSAALDLCLVARGWFDGYWEMGLHPWDVAAGSLIVSEAGGRVTSLVGGELDMESGSILASNGKIHDAMQVELGRARAAKWILEVP